MTAPTVPQSAISETILEKVAELAGLPRDDIDMSASIDTLGLESTDVVLLAMEIELETRTEIEPSIFMQFETLGEAADRIRQIVEAGGAQERSASEI